MERLARRGWVSAGMLGGREREMMWSWREGMLVRIRSNQWAESWVRRAPLPEMPWEEFRM